MIVPSAGGRSRSFGPLIILVGLLVVLAVVLVGPGRAGAHTDLLQGSPGPGQRVGGTVDFVDLVFLAPVTDVEVEVRGPDGEVVDGRMVVADGQIIQHRMEALSAEGRYVVDYRMVSDDGDLTEAGYFFTYEEGAFAPARLRNVDVPEEPILTTRNVVGAVAVALLAGGCGVLLLRFRRARMALAATRGRGRV